MFDSLLRRGAFFLCALFLSLAARAEAFRPDYTHTTWRATDGAPLDIRSIAQTPDGMLWVGSTTGLYRFDGIEFKRFSVSGMRLTLGRIQVLVARPSGELWIADDDDGLFVLREGKLSDIAPAAGNGPRSVTSLAFDSDGSAWVTSNTGVWRLAGGHWSRIAIEPGAGGGRPRDATEVGMREDGMLSVLADQYGRVWTSGLQGVYLLDRGTQRLRKVMSPDRVSRLIQSPDGRIWAIRRSAQAGEVLASVVPSPAVAPALPRAADSSRAASRSPAQFDRDANLWIVGCQDKVCLLRGAGAGRADAVAMPAAADQPKDAWALPTPVVNCVLEDSSGNVWFGTQEGLDRLRAKRVVRVPLPAGSADYTMAQDTEGNAWVAELQTKRVWKIRADGSVEVWFMTSSGIVQLDRRRMQRDAQPPVVFVSAVQAAGREFTGPRARLPAGTEDFSIDYGAPSLSRADGVRFQYMLEGRDRGWQDGGLRRTAWYTNIAPGRYTFRVRAVNEDGVASATDAAAVIVLEPTFTQSAAFRIALLVCAAMALHGLYRYRLRVATRRIADRHDARLAERERIARTLHDTFLQSVQGLVLRVHAAARKLPAGDTVRAQIEDVLDQADATLAEGRNQVHELRSGRNAERVLEETGNILAATFPGTAFHMTVKGERPLVRAHVQDEVAEIGAEALRNAFRHARATGVALTLHYGRDMLVLRVVDDGAGLDEARARERVKGRHWGLVGMRERAARIHARLDIAGAPGQGTRIELQVAARVAYDAHAAAA
jgi:signal transduction histidine kinase/streptogramin lyase